jgi:2OG-Fe(II) oxygenase superfamily
VLELGRIQQAVLKTKPYKWAFVDELFSPVHAADLAATFPCDKFKKVAGYDGEKGYEYFSRSLIHMNATEPSHVQGLSQSWRELAYDLLSPGYRHAMSQLTGRDLSEAPLEVNAIHYGPNCWLGPHVDLKEKIVTQILYFNEAWDRKDGGYLEILSSSDPSAVTAEAMPLVGNSAVLVRSDHSWHAVARIGEGCQLSRRSLNVIFHSPGAVSTMWPPGDLAKLSDYQLNAGKSSKWSGLLGAFRR